MQGITVVFGRRGSGKTTYVKEQIAEHGRVIVWDPLGEYGDICTVFDDGDPFLDALERAQKQCFRLALMPSEPLDELFDQFCRAAWVVGDVLAVVEEVSMVATATHVPASFAKIIRQGRHRAVSILAAAQRPSEVPRALTAQGSELVSFAQDEPIDQQYLRRYGGAALADRCQGLPRYEYAAWRASESDEQASEPSAEPPETPGN